MNENVNIEEMMENKHIDLTKKPMFEFYIRCNDGKNFYFYLTIDGETVHSGEGIIPDKIKSDILDHLLNVLYRDSVLEMIKQKKRVKSKRMSHSVINKRSVLDF
jgi:hypothetical protein